MSITKLKMLSENNTTIRKKCKYCEIDFDAKIEVFVRLDNKKIQKNVQIVCSHKCANGMLGIPYPEV